MLPFPPDPEAVFSIVNAVAAGAWLLLVCVPRWEWTRRIVVSGIVPLAFAGAYCVILAATFALGAPEGAGFGTLAAVAKLFSSPWGLLAGWIHYLCFDLVIGLDIERRMGHRPVLRVPCLALTFLVGPVGWMLAWLLTRGRGRGA